MVEPATSTSDGNIQSGRRKGFVLPDKGRFIEEHSSAAQPRSLGLKLGLVVPPRLHAFAYHLGIRKEPGCLVHPRLTELVPWEHARALVNTYMTVVHPVVGFLNSDLLYHRAHTHWNGEGQGLAFETVAGGVIILASLFSNQLPEETEMELSLHLKAVLEDPVVSRTPA